jgi:hypothetical protein
MRVDTHCKGCVFAEYEHVFDNGQLPPDGGPPGFSNQTGCRLGRIERFRETGAEVVPLETPDDRDVSLAVLGRFCNGKRDAEWAARQTINLEVAAWSEVYVRPDVVIPFGPGKTLDDLSLSLHSVTDRGAGSIHVVHNNPDVQYGKVRQLLADQFNGSSQVWFTTFVLKDALRSSDYAAADLAFKKITSLFYLCLPAGEEMPPGLVGWLDEQLNHRMKRMSLVHPAQGNWYLAQTGLHKSFDGNEPCDDLEVEVGVEGTAVEPQTVEVHLPNLPAKIQFYAERTGQSYLVEQYGG